MSHLPDSDSGVDSGAAGGRPAAHRQRGRSTPRSWRSGWRAGTPLVVLVSGALFAVSFTNADGTDLRPGRYKDLPSLVQDQSEDVSSLQQRAAELQAEVDELSAGVADREVRRRTRAADAIAPAAGLTEVTGSGISVVLSDAPTEAIEQALDDDSADLNLFVVHQQDIQAVVNAFWAGGADAVTVQGQRIVTTTGIKCTGSAVQLQGVPYPQPYTIQAIGDPDELLTALATSPDVVAYRSDAERPDVGIGWSMETVEEITAPPYTGLLDLTAARPR